MNALTRAIITLLLLGSGLFIFHQQRQLRPSRIAAATEKGILLIGNGTEIESLDPHLVTGQPEHHVISALFEGLVAPDPENPDLDAPGVALSWHSPDFITWTFQLRPEATWSDGVPITSADFLYAFQRILSPELGSYYAEMLYFMEGAAAFNQGTLTDFTQVGCRAPDPHTLIIQLTGPAPFFPSVLKHYTWFPVPRHQIETFGSMTARDTAWARPGNLVCNGPFTLSSWRINHLLTVEKNPRYWDAATTQLQGIHFFPIDNQETEERLFLDQQLHITNSVPLSKLPAYRRDRPPHFHQAPELTCEFYRFNTTRPPFDKPEVRRALSLAIDRSTLIENVLRSGHQPATGLTPPGAHPDYPPLTSVHFDPDKARQLLADAGFPAGKTFPKFEILTNSSGAARTVAEFFQESWKKHLGLEVSILQQEWQVYLTSQQNLKFDVARAGWVGDYTDPFTFLSIWRANDGNNNTGWSNPDYEGLLTRASQEPDSPTRLSLLRQAETMLLEAAPICPVFWRMNSTLIRPEVQNWKHSVISHRSYKTISLRP